MRHIWNTIGAIIVTALVVQALASMVKPYVPYLIVAAVVYVGGKAVYRSHRHW